MPLMSAGASVAVVPATLCRFEPFVVIAVKLFHFVKLAAFHHDAQLFKAFRAFHPKTGNARRRIGRKQCRYAFMPRNPIAVVRTGRIVRFR
ncbi:Uncharacterised protein [Neisseria meningitidis]|nr:Uncharacterised protein [Neisseria meningitidis]